MLSSIAAAASGVPSWPIFKLRCICSSEMLAILSLSDFSLSRMVLHTELRTGTDIMRVGLAPVFLLNSNWKKWSKLSYELNVFEKERQTICLCVMYQYFAIASAWLPFFFSPNVFDCNFLEPWFGIVVSGFLFHQIQSSRLTFDWWLRFSIDCTKILILITWSLIPSLLFINTPSTPIELMCIHWFLYRGYENLNTLFTEIYIKINWIWINCTAQANVYTPVSYPIGIKTLIHFL